jgi:hypothetical protein
MSWRSYITPCLGAVEIFCDSMHGGSLDGLTLLEVLAVSQKTRAMMIVPSLTALSGEDICCPNAQYLNRHGRDHGNT